MLILKPDTDYQFRKDTEDLRSTIFEAIADYDESHPKFAIGASHLAVCSDHLTQNFRHGMNPEENLYSELKSDIEILTEPLFSFSEKCLKKRGNFVPHGATLDSSGVVALVGADPNNANGMSNSREVLPLLHEGLREQAKKEELIAIGVAENVVVTCEGEAPTQAIKVLFEHKRGLVVALYLPFKKRFFRGYVFGNVFRIKTNSEVNAW